MITGEELVEDLVEKYPEIVKILREENIVCIVCGEPAWGTLNDLIDSKGYDKEDVIKKINSKLNN